MKILRQIAAGLISVAIFKIIEDAMRGMYETAHKK